MLAGISGIVMPRNTRSYQSSIRTNYANEEQKRAKVKPKASHKVQGINRVYCSTQKKSLHRLWPKKLQKIWSLSNKQIPMVMRLKPTLYLYSINTPERCQSLMLPQKHLLSPPHAPWNVLSSVQRMQKIFYDTWRYKYPPHNLWGVN